jgi:hypothetical protein
VTTTTRRLPLEPLLAVVPPTPATGWGSDHLTPIGALERLTGVCRNSVYRWRRQGGSPEDRADELACRLGLHPGEVWGADWWR